MILRTLLIVLTAACATTVVSTAFAHTAPRSSSTWLIDGSSVQVVMVVPGSETVRLSQSGPSDADPRTMIAQYLTTRVGVLRDGQACQMARPPDARVSSGDWSSVVEIRFSCSASGRFALTSSAFFELNANHTHLARVLTHDGVAEEFAFTKDRTFHVVNPETQAQGTWASNALAVHSSGCHPHRDWRRSLGLLARTCSYGALVAPHAHPHVWVHNRPQRHSHARKHRRCRHPHTPHRGTSRIYGVARRRRGNGNVPSVTSHGDCVLLRRHRGCGRHFLPNDRRYCASRPSIRDLP